MRALRLVGAGVLVFITRSARRVGVQAPAARALACRLLLLWHWQPPGMHCIPPASNPPLPLPPRRSVVETIKIVTETLEALFNMRLAIPAGVVRCLTEGVDNALQK